MKSLPLNFLFINFIRITLIIAIIIWFLEGNWINIFLATFTFFITFIDKVFSKYNIFLPKTFQFTIIFFIYCSLILWSIWGFYDKYEWWDMLLHSFSWIALWFIGFLILYIFYKSNKLSASPILIFVFSISFAMALWAIWEIFEFLIDISFNANWQWKNIIVNNYSITPVNDTMHDLILDFLWALIAWTSWYFFLKRWEKWFFMWKLIKKFEKLNKPLFKKNK